MNEQLPIAEKDVHAATLHGERVVCTCGDFNCASLDYTACSFAIHKGGIDYCKGDVRFPETHATLCPAYSTRLLPPAVHVVADPLCDLHQEWPTKPHESARCETCRPLPPVTTEEPPRVTQPERRQGGRGGRG